MIWLNICDEEKNLDWIMIASEWACVSANYIPADSVLCSTLSRCIALLVRKHFQYLIILIYTIYTYYIIIRTWALSIYDIFRSFLLILCSLLLLCVSLNSIVSPWGLCCFSSNTTTDQSAHYCVHICLLLDFFTLFAVVIVEICQCLNSIRILNVLLLDDDINNN